MGSNRKLLNQKEKQIFGPILVNIDSSIDVDCPVKIAIFFNGWSIKILWIRKTRMYLSNILQYDMICIHLCRDV